MVYQFKTIFVFLIEESIFYKTTKTAVPVCFTVVLVSLFRTCFGLHLTVFILAIKLSSTLSTLLTIIWSDKVKVFF